MPKKSDIVSNKGYCDLVYSWFQCNSEFDSENNVRFVCKDQVKYTSISEELGMDRRTVRRYVDKLFAMDLLYEDSGKFILKPLENTVATLVPYLTLRKIQNSLHKNSINIFVYLLNRFVANSEQPYFVTYSELKKYIGISTATSSNNVVVSDILEILSLLNLIEYQVKQTDATRCNIQIVKVNNRLGK